MNLIETISSQLMIFAGITMYIFGLIGNILNVWVFTVWSRSTKGIRKHAKHSRTSNSSLYLLTSSMANLILIIYPLLTRIMFDGYQYRVTSNNVFILCKLRFYALHTFDLISLTCICMAIFDRYLISSRKVHLRKLSARRHRTKIIILCIICLIGSHGIPLTIYYDTSNTGRCAVLSTDYLYYYLYVYQLFLHGLFPITFLSIFGILTFQQLKTRKQKHRRRYGSFSSDKQLGRMLLLMSVTIILSSIPYCIEQFLNVMFIGGDCLRSSYFVLFHVVSHLLYYTYPVLSFYVYYISTPNFRIQVQRILFCRSHPNYVVYHQVKKDNSS